MAKPFFERLITYYEAVGSVLRGQAAVAGVFPNATDIGLARERLYLRFLEDHLPDSCAGTLGGFLFGLDGSESSQMDIIVTCNVAPKYKFEAGAGGKSVACVDGALAVASVKSNLTSTELREALANIASIPPKADLAGRTMPLLTIPNYEDWPFKIVFASKGAQLDTVVRTLADFYTAHPDIPPTRRPHIIHVAGEYVLVRTGKDGGKTRDGSTIPPHVFYPMIDRTDAFGLAYVVQEIQKNAVAAGQILYSYDAILDGLPIGRGAV